MREMHRHNAIHRDLKPANIFLDGAKEVRITDFGLSRFNKGNLEMTRAIGTPLFMAPELYDDSGERYDGSVDVYAFGMVVHYMFSNGISLDDGCETRSPQQLLLRILRGARPKRPRGISDDLWDLIRSCWDENPNKRPTFAEIVRKLLESSNAPVAGTDERAYREYQHRIASASAAPPRPLKTSDAANEWAEDPSRAVSRYEDRTHRKDEFRAPGRPVRRSRYDFRRSSKKAT
jgi:serine/threonine protein kinase